MSHTHVLVVGWKAQKANPPVVMVSSLDFSVSWRRSLALFLNRTLEHSSKGQMKKAKERRRCWLVMESRRVQAVLKV